MAKLTEEQEKLLTLSDDAQRNLNALIEFAKSVDTSDKRLVAVAATQMELGFMALNKAICNPPNKIATTRQTDYYDKAPGI